MSYLLHGIPTRMTVDWQPRYDYHVAVSCPCGWTSSRYVVKQRVVPRELDGACIFHYTHCPHAKAPIGDDEGSAVDSPDEVS